MASKDGKELCPIQPNLSKVPEYKIHINTLPGTCLQAIFQNQPLADQLVNLSVCSKWEIIQRNELKSRKSLTLLFDADATSLIESSRIPQSEFLDDHVQQELNYACVKLIRFNSIIIHPDDKEVPTPVTQYCTLDGLPLLVDLFPRITTFTVACSQPQDTHLELLTRLLFSAWQSKLIHLQLYLSLYCPWLNVSRAAPIFQLIKAINELSTLKHLTITFNSLVILSDQAKYLNLPILSRLESFHFASNDPIECLYPSLIYDAAPNGALTKIALRNRVLPDNGNLPEDQKQLPLSLTAKFTQLFLDGEIKFLAQCLNLSRLRLEGVEFSPATLQNLSQLKCLLEFEFKPSQVIDVSSEQYPRLGSVKILRLWTEHRPMEWTSHDDMTRYHLPWIFPGLQVLQFSFDNLQCSLCDYMNASYFIPYNAQRNRQCLLSLAGPLKASLPALKFGQLRPRYFHSAAKKTWTFDELLPR